MNKLFFAVLIIVSAPLFGQNVFVNRLEVTDQKTTTLVFPGKITAVDLGTNHIIAQKVDGTENILQVKAVHQSFEETNMTVITNTGSIYQFDVTFNATPESSYLVLPTGGKAPSSTAIFSKRQNALFYQTVYRAISQRKIQDIQSETTEGIELTVNGLYTAKDQVFVLLKLANHSSLSYDVQSVQCHLSSRKTSKRSPIEEIPLEVVNQSNAFDSIGAGASQYVILAFDKFTVDKGKQMTISIIEHGGSRHLKLQLKSKHFKQIERIDMK